MPKKKTKTEKKLEYADFVVLFSTHWDRFHEQLGNFNEVLLAADLVLPAPQARLLRKRSVNMAREAVYVASVFTIIDFLACGGKTFKDLIHQIRCEMNLSEEDEAVVKTLWDELQLLEKQHAADGNY